MCVILYNIRHTHRQVAQVFLLSTVVARRLVVGNRRNKRQNWHCPMSAVLRPIKWFYHEFGIVSIHETGRNAYFIILARTFRMFAYGCTFILGINRDLLNFLVLKITMVL